MSFVYILCINSINHKIIYLSKWLLKIYIYIIKILTMTVPKYYVWNICKRRQMIKYYGLFISHSTKHFHLSHTNIGGITFILFLLEYSHSPRSTKSNCLRTIRWISWDFSYVKNQPSTNPPLNHQFCTLLPSPYFTLMWKENPQLSSRLCFKHPQKCISKDNGIVIKELGTAL